MTKNRIITVQGIPVTVSNEDIDDYIRITDIAVVKSDNSRAADVIRNWLRNRSTLEFLSTWEEIFYPNFKVLESKHLKKEAGLVTFTPSVSEWVENDLQKLEWDAKRFLSKNNYLIQTDAVKNYLMRH